MTWFDPFLRIVANASDNFTPTEMKERKLAGLIKRRDDLLESQSKWTPENSLELDGIVDGIKRLNRMLGKAS